MYVKGRGLAFGGSIEFPFSQLSPAPALMVFTASVSTTFGTEQGQTMHLDGNDTIQCVVWH